MADPTRPEPTPRDVEVAREITAKLQRCDKAADALGQHLGCAEEWEEYTRATVARHREEIVHEARLDEQVATRQSEERLREALWNLQAEVSAILGIVGPELRAAAGNTNVNVLTLRRDEARALLASAGGPDSAPMEATRSRLRPLLLKHGLENLPDNRDAVDSETGKRISCADAPPPAPVQPAERAETREPPMLGAWPAECIQRGFVDGAKWWEYESTKCTMWQSDQRKAEAEAVRRYGEPASPPPGTTQEEREQGEARYCMTCATIHRPDECWDPEER